MKLLIPVFVLALVSCRQDVTKPNIGLNIASPIDITNSSDGEHFYALNADFNHEYDTGSILTINSDGRKVSATPLRRLGRSMIRSGNFLYVTTDRDASPESSAELFIYSLAAPQTPALVSSKPLPDCSPIGLAKRDNYPMFAVTCTNGKIFLGEHNAGEVYLEGIRKFPGFARRAIFIHPESELLMAFVTDLGKPSFSDALFSDKGSHDDSGAAIPGAKPSDLPDYIGESVSRKAALRRGGSPYQFVLLDLAKLRSWRKAHNTFGGLKTENGLSEELRWLYFNAANFDGTPDQISTLTSATEKYYRSNIWQASPNPSDPYSFYISQRGKGTVRSSPFANSVFRVTISGNPRIEDSGSIPLTETFLQFERVYGFKGSLQDPASTYLGSFAVAPLANGEEVLYTNSFRDLVNFSEPNYEISATSLRKPYWFTKESSSSIDASFYQLAVSTSGRLLTSSFYKNRLLMYQANYGQKLTKVLEIN